MSLHSGLMLSKFFTVEEMNVCDSTGKRNLYASISSEYNI